MQDVLKPWAAALTMFVTLGVASAALAQVPTLPKAGAETKALGVLVGNHEKAGKKMPPMMPPVESSGTMKCDWTAGGLWLACDIDETLKGGKPFKRFQAHLTMGWDFDAKAYRAHMVSALGTGIAFNGHADGDKLVFESKPQKSPLGTIRLRWTFDLTNPKEIGFHDERSINGAPWFTFEKTTIR